MVLKITFMLQIKAAFVRSSVNTKSTLRYPFELCSDVSLIGTIYSRNWHPLFVLTLLISDLTFAFFLVSLFVSFLLVSLFVSVQPDISKIFFRIMSENNCSHKNVLLIIKHIWRTNWITSGHEISHRRFCRMDKNYMSTVQGSSAWYFETYCINPLKAELNPICHLLALLGGAPIVVVSRLRVKTPSEDSFFIRS